MKKIIFIMILTILIGLFVYSNEEKSPVIENLYNFSNEDTTLLWYKNIEFTLGYNLGLCRRGSSLIGSAEAIPFSIFTNLVYWLNSVESGFRFPINNRIFEIGLGYGWANIVSGAFGAHFHNTLINNSLANWANLDFHNVRKYYLYTGYIVAPSLIFGLELNYSQGYGTECYSNHFHVYNVKRDLLGGGIYFKLCNTKKNFKKIRFDPYLMIKIAGCSEIRSSSPYSELWDKKLKIWYTGLYIGFNINR